MTILGENKSAGVFNNFREELIKKGTKFTAKGLMTLDYTIINPLNWTADE